MLGLHHSFRRIWQLSYESFFFLTSDLINRSSMKENIEIIVLISSSFIVLVSPNNCKILEIFQITQFYYGFKNGVFYSVTAFEKKRSL